MLYYASKISKNMRRREPEGYLICANVPIARSGTQEYYQDEIGQDGDDVVKVHRPEEEVFSEATIASFEGMPVTNDHPDDPEGVNVDNVQYLGKGHCQNVHRGEGKEKDLLIADLFIEDPQTIQEASFLWGYYTHLVTDAEFQRTIRDEKRIQAAWKRIKAIPELAIAGEGMPETWDSVKQLLPRSERYKEISTIEREYLDEHPTSGFLTEIVNLTSFPDWLAFLPKGAIVRKVGVLGNIPEKGESKYPFTAMTRTEYAAFVDRAVALAVETISRYLRC